MPSREVGRLINFFHGPGESFDIKGDGSGDISAIALSMGDDRAELGAEPTIEVEPILFARALLMLEFREIVAVDFKDCCGTSIEF